MSLDSLHQDLLDEVFNLGAGRAAASLSELLGNDIEIGLSVPHTEVLTLSEMAAKIQKGDEAAYCGISLDYSGGLSGSSILVYTEEESLQLVKLLIGVTDDVNDMAGFTGMYEDALLEVGNLVLNSCLSSVANFLSLEFESEVPSLWTGTCERIISNDGSHSLEQSVLYVEVAFNIEDEGLGGHIGFCLNMEAMESLENHIKHYIDTQLGA